MPKSHLYAPMTTASTSNAPIDVTHQRRRYFESKARDEESKFLNDDSTTPTDQSTVNVHQRRSPTRWQWRTSRLIDGGGGNRLFTTGLTILFSLLGLLILIWLNRTSNVDELQQLRDFQHKTPSEFRSVYSDVNSDDGQIWLINLHEIRRRRHLNPTGPKDRTGQRIHGLARDCGLRCAFKLRHNDADGRFFDVHLRRRRFNRMSSDTHEFVTPFVQYMDNENQTRAQPSRISVDCLYEAQVNGTEESGIVNLCDPNGGLFGTLALTDGAFVIEPLIDITDSTINDLNSTNSRRFKRSSLQLKPHLIYRARSQTFDSPLSSSSHSSSTSDSDSQENFDSDEDIDSFFGERKRRSANSWDHFVEVMVVADLKMQQYHKNDLENYILTLFSTVASIYRHASLGASVNIIVVRIVILRYDNGHPRISEQAQDTLQQFCAWQQNMNDRNEAAASHHDVAILLTRKDICRTKNKCDTLGLAELGTMCDAKKSCAIIEDNGLSAAFTIAHELGHIFNIPHDDERRCAQYMPLNKNSYHIMAPTLEYNTNPWAWSPCSSAMLEKFLDSHRSQTQCIYDKPVERRYFDKMFNFPLAGELYEINQQCRYVFGDTAEICPYMPTCRRLWCSTYSGFQMGCRTQHMPWADGTRCGHNQWCHQGSCIGLAPKDLKKINGEWGRWQEYGACSRTCGGGVKKGVRDCDSPRPVNGGKYCIGQRERYESCNTQECPREALGFREVQCAEFNNKDVGIHGIPKSTTWVPKYTGIASSERCRLYCRAHDSAAFYLLRDKVLDGTPCARNVDDICIDGTCHPAGCDHRLNSNMKRDACGLCGGHGQTCKTVEGNYNERGTFGYNEVLRIPAGSANIDISQKSYNNDKDDDNYLALKTADGFLLNGDYQVSVFRQQIPITGTVLEYSGSDYTVERINGSGPIGADIYIHVLSVGNLNPPDVSYKYMIPKDSENRRTASHAYPKQPNYYWTYDEEWSRCSSKCQGTQTQQLVCMDPLSTKPVNDQYCVNKRPDVNKRMCNVECSFKWKSTVVSGCSAHCGSGEQQQQSFCVRSFQNNKPDEQVTDRECEALGLRRPPTRIQCYTDCNGRKWTYSEWSTCSTTCGNSGIKRRQSFCVDGSNRRLDSRYCERIPHESIEMECNRLPCPSWVYGQWSECSRSCDGGMRRRHAVCKDATGAELSAESCPTAERLDQEKCNDHQCTKWRFGSWSQCSQTCGVGFESRDARCIVASTGAELPDDRCDVREKHLRKSCQKRSCPEWKVGSWSSCSVTCGSGYRERSVQCVEENVGRDGAARPISEARCIQPRPSSHEPCAGAACPFWRLGQWSHCSVTCGSGSRRRTVDCVQPDGQLVDASLCTGAGASQKTSPLTMESCRLIACPQWKPTAWSQCSKSCGDNGKQTRSLQCVRGDTEVVSDVECRLHHKPKTERQCDSAPCGYSNQHQHVQMYPRLQRPEYFWATGTWSQCSKSCNGGTQKRQVQCYGHQRVLPEAYCRNVEVEPSERSCNTQPCVHWVTGDWTSCSSSCGALATQRRLVSCVADNPTASGASNVSTADCDPTTQPQATRSCNLPACSREPRPRYGEWKTGEWSTCSVSCGVGYRRRTIFCTTPLCIDGQKPTQYEHCNLGKCGQKNNWQVGPWSHCSVSCGSDGFQMRKIWCQADFHQMKHLDDSECDRTEKPIASRGCASAKCLSTSTQSTTTTTARSFPPQKYSWISTNWSTVSPNFSRQRRGDTRTKTHTRTQHRNRSRTSRHHAYRNYFGN